MAYDGYEVPIVLGQLGLQTDSAQSQLPPNAAILANNIAFFSGVISKSNGTTKYNTTASLGNPIVAGFDWFPTASQQRMVVLTSDGKIWKDTGNGSFSSNTPLTVSDTQRVVFSGIPVSGTFTWHWNGNDSTVTSNWNDTIAQLQTALRAVTGLSTATLQATLGFYPSSGTTPPAGTFNNDGYINGYTFIIPGTTSSQPLLSVTNNSLVTAASVAITETTTHIQAGATGLGVITTDTQLVAGGNEVQGNPRKLFFFTGGAAQVAVMTGDSTVVTGIRRPAADWSSSLPVFGTIYQSRLVALMNHNIYISKLADHEDFTTSATDGSGASQFPIFPGEGDGLIGAVVYKGGLLLFKRPVGVYLFQWNGGDITDPTNVSISKLSDSFAAGSPHSFVQVLDDLIGGSVSGSLFSQQATNAFGALEAGDVLRQLQVRNYFRQNFDNSGIQKMQSVYYPEKIMGMFTGRDTGTNPQNRILMYDESSGQNVRISVETKDQPTCMFMRKDTNLVPRPFYGANDGFVYQMDQPVAAVNGVAYTGEFQTPYVDFSFLDPKLADKKKLFEFLSVTFQPVGQWAFYVDCYIDGVFATTITYNMQQSGAVLDSFILDQSKLGAASTAVTLRLPMKSCAGAAISFRIYNGVLNQTFTVERLTVSFRESGEQNRSSKS